MSSIEGQHGLNNSSMKFEENSISLATISLSIDMGLESLLV